MALCARPTPICATGRPTAPPWLCARPGPRPAGAVGGAQRGRPVAGHERAAPAHRRHMLCVASGSGYWRDNAPPTRRKILLWWYGIAPLLTALHGCLPGRRLGLVGDLPAGVLWQWRQWCLHPNYGIGVVGEPLRPAAALSAACLFDRRRRDDVLALDHLPGQLVPPLPVARGHPACRACAGRAHRAFRFFPCRDGGPAVAARPGGAGALARPCAGHDA